MSISNWGCSHKAIISPSHLHVFWLVFDMHTNDLGCQGKLDMTSVEPQHHKIEILELRKSSQSGQDVCDILHASVFRIHKPQCESHRCVAVFETELGEAFNSHLGHLGLVKVQQLKGGEQGATASCARKRCCESVSILASH
jgi:hypothetical protein